MTLTSLFKIHENADLHVCFHMKLSSFISLLSSPFEVIFFSPPLSFYSPFLSVSQEHPLPEEHHPLEPHHRLHPEERHLVHRPADHEPRGAREQRGTCHLLIFNNTRWEALLLSTSPMKRSTAAVNVSTQLGSGWRKKTTWLCLGKHCCLG